MAQIASVAAITGTGKAFAVNEQGISRELKAGDVLQKGETIRTVGDVRVELVMDDGRLLAVAPNQVLRLDENVTESDQRPTAQDSAVGAPAATADTVLQALERGTDLSTELEATAAGLGGGGADGGSSFVQLLRIVEGVDPLAYNYTYTAPELPPDLQANPEAVVNTPPTILVGDGGLVADNAVADVYEPALDNGGSNAAGLGELVQGKFLVSDPEGVASLVSVTINGVVIPMGNLVGAEVPGASGVLTITSFDSITGLATFEYKLTGPTTDVSGQPETEIFSFTTTDGEFTSNTATITLTIVDDVPTAKNDTATPDEDKPVTINAFGNDVAGADGVNLTTGVALTTGPTQGTVVYNGDGTFTYTPTAGKEGTDSFTYTITDKDGDPSTATVNITLATDSTPTINVVYVGEGGGVVNEGKLPDGNLGGTLTTSGTLPITTGQDTLAKLEVGGKDVTNGGEVVGPNGTLAVTHNQDGTYSWTYTLKTATTDVNGVDETNAFAVKVTDSDGDTASSTLTVRITDDVPAITVTATAGADALVVDESNFAINATANFADNFSNTPRFGSDGAATSNSVTSAYTLGVNTATATGLVDSLTQQAVVLSVNGSGVVEGRTAESSDIVFTVSVDGAGTVTLDQTRAVMHDVASVGDTSEAATLSAANLVTLTRTDTIIDGDGDISTGTASINIGTAISFLDDGPSISADVPVADTEEMALVTSDAVDSAEADFSGAFSFTSNEGADTATLSAISYALSVTGVADEVTGLVDSGLMTSAGNAAIYLYEVNGVIVGSTATDAGDVGEANTVFSLTVDADGKVTLEQFQAIEHTATNGDDGAEDFTADGDFTDDSESLAAGLVGLTATQTITDADGDTQTASSDALDLGGLVSFTDVGPSISADVPVADTEEMALVTSDAVDSAEADFSGAFSFTSNEGADTATLSAISYALSVTGVADEVTGLVDSGLMTSAGNAAIYLYEVNGVIVGSTATDAGDVGEANTVFSLTVDADGKVTLEQFQAIEHTATNGDDGAEDFTADGDFTDDSESLAAGLVGLTATQTITDADGDTQTASSDALDLGGLVSFTDVGPSISADVPVADTEEMALVTSDAVDSAEADFSGAFSFTSNEGADTATLSAISYALSVTGVADEVTGLVDSGLMTSAGNAAIYLYEVNGVIVGSTATDAGDVGEANTVFSLTVDADGKVTLEQFQAIEHTATNGDDGAEDFTADGDFTDDSESLAAGLVGLTATQTITDADGDTQTASSDALDLGGLVSFTDVGPDLSASASETGQAVLTTSDADTVGANFGTANTNYATAFTFTPTQGADTATQGTISYALVLKAAANVDTNSDTVLDHVDSGLKTSVGDQPIYLYSVGGVIVGSTSTTAPTGVEITNAATNANIVFTLSNSAGTVTLNQYQAIEHTATNGDDGAEDFTADGVFTDDFEVLANNLVALRATQTITDSDGDTKTASADLDLGGNVKFTDVGPIAVNQPTLTLTESHVSDTDWLPSKVHLVSGSDGSGSLVYTEIATIGGLSIGDTLKINWSGDSGTINWKLVGIDTSNLNQVLTGSSTDKTMDAVLSALPANGSYKLYVDYDGSNATKNIDLDDVHVLHTVTSTDDGNVIVDVPGADTVGADGAAVYSITYVNASGVTMTEVLGGDGFANVVTKYGTLHMEADGDYTYTVKQDAVPLTETDSQVEDNFTYTLMDGDGDTASANMNYVINDIKSPSVLDVTMITNTNNQIQPVILTFVDQVHPEYAYARLFALGAQGQQGTFTPDTGFNIDNTHNYVVGLEAASTSTKVNLTDFTIEGVPIFGQATGGGGGVTSLILDNDSSTSSDQTAMVAVIAPNTPPATQVLTASTDGDGTGTTMTDGSVDSSASTVNYLYGADGNDTLNGSTGTDILNGGAGVDTLKGGAGNDVLVYDSGDNSLGGLLDGGDGDDVLRIDDGALALFNNPSLGQGLVSLVGNTAIKNVEVLLITDDADGAADKGTTLFLRAEDVLSFTTDGHHELTIAGNNSDKLDLSNDTTQWTHTGTSTDGNFEMWAATFNGTAVTLKVETEVQVLSPNP